MSTRFYVTSPIQSDNATLAGAQAHHLLHVLRAKVGSEVVLFDGSGAEFTARVRKTTRREVQLEVLSRSDANRELGCRVVMGVALPKGDRQSWLVEKAVELGVERSVPLQSARSVARPTPSVLARLRRTVIESSKQCGRNRLMEVASPEQVGDYFASAPQAALRWMAHPGCALPADVSGARDGRPATDAVYLAVGPEGGFSETECAAAVTAGWHPIWLGPRILRVETAAVALAALIALRELDSFREPGA